MEDGPVKVPPGEAAPVVGPMGVGAPLVGLNMEVAKDSPVEEILMEVGHKGTPLVEDPLVVDHMEVVHLTDQEMVMDTALEVPKGVANSQL